MNHKNKRLMIIAGIVVIVIAIVVAVVLFLPSHDKDVSPAVKGVAGVYARGGKIKTETSIDINAETLNSMITMFGGASSDDEQAAQMMIINTALNIIRKLSVTTLTDGKVGYIGIGNENGELINAYAMINSEDSFVTTSMLSGIELILPDAVASVPSFSEEDVQVVMKSLDGYVVAISEFANEELLANAQLEEGSFALAGSGTFEYKAKFELKSHQVADMLERLLKIFKEDKALQDQLEAFIKSAAATAQAAGESVPGAKEIIEEIEKGIAEIRGNNDEKLANLTVYSAKDTDAVHIEVEMLENETAMALITVASLPAQNGTDIRFSMLTADGSEGPVDWAAARQAVLSGGQSASLLLDVAVNERTNEAANREEVDGGIDIYVMGIKIGIAINSSTTITGEYATESTVAFSAFSPDPLFTVVSKGYETAESIPAPDRDSLKKVQLSENMSEEDQNNLLESLTVSLPELIEKLKVVLPEEGQMLAVILEGFMNPGVPYQQ